MNLSGCRSYWAVLMGTRGRRALLLPRVRANTSRKGPQPCPCWLAAGAGHLQPGPTPGDHRAALLRAELWRALGLAPRKATPLCPPCPPCRAAGAGQARRSLRGVPEHRRAGGAAAQRAPDLRQPAAPLHRQVQPAGLPGPPTGGAAARPLLTSAHCPQELRAVPVHAGGGRRARGEGLRPAAPGPRLSRREIRVLAAALRPGPWPRPSLHQLCRAPSTLGPGSQGHGLCPALRMPTAATAPPPAAEVTAETAQRTREASTGPGDSHSHTPRRATTFTASTHPGGAPPTTPADLLWPSRGA